MHWGGFLVLATACLPLGACEGESLQWQGAHVDFYASPSFKVCGGTYHYLDMYVPFLATELATSTPTGLEYHWIDSTTEVCWVDAIGCAKAHRAFSTNPFHLHELAHSTTWEQGLHGWPFFREGIATAYDPWRGDGSGIRYLITPDPMAPLPDPREEMAFEAEELSYHLAASFIAFLLSRYGPERYVAFVQGLPSSRDMGKLQTHFRKTYGVELEDEAELFKIGAPCPADPNPVLVYDCTMPEIPWQDGGWAYDKVMDCAADDVVGGTSPDRSWPSLHGVTLQVPSSGPYHLRLESDDEDTVVQVGACFGCPWEERFAVAFPDHTTTVTDLDAGLYYVRLLGNSDTPAETRVTLIPAPAP